MLQLIGCMHKGNANKIIFTIAINPLPINCQIFIMMVLGVVSTQCLWIDICELPSKFNRVEIPNKEEGCGK